MLKTVNCSGCNSVYSAILAECPSCGLLNPLVVAGAVAPRAIETKVLSVAAEQPRASSSASSASEAMGQQTAQSSRDPQDLATQIEAFKKIPGERAVIAVYGVRNAGKSYLNERFGFLFNATVTRSDNEKRVKRSTKRETFTSAEFQFRYGSDDKKQWPVLVIDLPGEEFMSGTDSSQMQTALIGMDALVVYIPASTVGGKYFASSDVRAATQTAPQLHYVDLFKKIRGAHSERCTTPVFVALSKADTLTDWES